MDNNQKKSVKIINDLEQVAKERLATLILGGFGLVAALAWNEAIQSLFSEIFGSDRQSLFAKFLYAFIVTFSVVLISFWISRFINTRRPNSKD